jgi:hypothetical protein
VSESGHRGTFASVYALGRERYMRSKKLRLLECEIYYCMAGDSRYLDEISDGAFCAVDSATREKGWFEWPHGYSVPQVGEMIESHFGVAAYRISAKVWFV